MRIVFVFLLVCFFGLAGQNPASTCTGAASLTPSSTCSPISYTLPGTYVSGIAGLCASGYSNLEEGWYIFTARSTRYTVELTGNYHHSLAVYSGTCTLWTHMACDFALAGETAQITFNTTRNTSYRIRMIRNSGPLDVAMTGTICLKISDAPGGVSNGLKGWFRADGNVVTSGSDVTAWYSEVGTAHFTSVTGLPQLDLTGVNVNPGIPSVRFTGTNSLFQTGVIGNQLFSSTDNTIFIIRRNSCGCGNTFQWVASTSNQIAINESWISGTAHNITLNRPTFTNTITAINGAVGNRWQVITARTGLSSDELFIDGVLVTSGLGGANGIASAGTLTLGGGSTSMDAYIGEIVVFNSNLSDADRQKVESYLAMKYGVTLGSYANTVTPIDYVNSSGTTIWSSDPTYKWAINGIGRDDATGLDKRKSRSSVHFNYDILTMALVDNLGSFASPNAFATDQSFMLWGRTGGTFLEQDAVAPPSILKLLNVKWKIREIGTVGAVAMQFDLLNPIATVVSSSTFYDIRLIIDTDGDGDFATGFIKRITPSSYAGGIVTFNSVDLTDGNVFTLATLVEAPGGVSTGLEIWQRASIMTSTDTHLAQLDEWYNAGASNFDFNRVTGSTSGFPRFISNTINFNPSIEFADFCTMESGNGAIKMRPTTNNSHSFVLFKTAQNSGTSDFRSSPSFISTDVTSGIRDYGFGLRSGQIGAKIGSGNTWNGYSTRTDCNNDVPHIAMTSRIRSATVTNPSTLNIQLDGISMPSITSTGNSYALDGSDATGTPYKGTCIGGQTSTGSDIVNSMQYLGYLPEVIVYNNSLSLTNERKVNSYLAVKYGITLGNTSTPVSYINSTGSTTWTGSAVFQNDIIGIARDDRSGLRQYRSVSIELDNILDIALVDQGGTQLSPNSMDLDLESFIVGNNDLSLSFSNVDVDGVTIGSRMRRIFKVQETGLIGNVFIEVDMSKVPVGYPGSMLRLLVDRDADGFADNDVAPIVPSSFDFSTSKVGFTVNLSNDDYFTFGILSAALPVAFLNYRGYAAFEENILEWSTSEEVNNKHFIIQRSFDARTWQAIAVVDALKNSGIKNYDFKDTNIDESSVIYYRLIQLDIDGTSTVSEVITINRKDEGFVLVSPNPSSDIFHVNIKSKEVNILRVLNSLGVLIHEMELTSGENLVDLSIFPSGVYHFEIFDGTRNVVRVKVLLK